MPITANGFEARRFSDIVANINADLIANLATDFNTSPDTVLGIITSIFASGITDVEELAQTVADNFNLDKAEGKSLDDIVALIGLRRLEESFSTGFVHLTSNGETSISGIVPAGYLVSDSEGNDYRVTQQVNLTASECTKAVIKPRFTLGVFELVIEGESFEVIFSETSFPETIVTALRDVINASAPTEYTVEVEGGLLIIDKVNKSLPLEVSIVSSLIVDDVEVISQVAAIDAGPLNPPIGTITNITPSALVSAATNYFLLTTGRAEESDEELRGRHKDSVQIVGNATAPAIFAKLSNLEGVSQVRIFENKGIVPDASGRSGKSYECVVEGGSASDIATVIWQTKPASVETYGNVNSVVVDYAGNLQGINWSRPEIVYLNVKVSYTPYTEEVLPDDLEATIKQTIIDTGNQLGLDVDVIPERFYGPIYASVTGLGPLSIEIGTSINPTSPLPDTIPYQTTPISIGSQKKADFDEVRIQVVEV